jgi:hypothetical protein
MGLKMHRTKQVCPGSNTSNMFCKCPLPILNRTKTILAEVSHGFPQVLPGKYGGVSQIKP